MFTFVWAVDTLLVYVGGAASDHYTITRAVDAARQFITCVSDEVKPSSRMQAARLP
jgi:hypothetical protein